MSRVRTLGSMLGGFGQACHVPSRRTGKTGSCGVPLEGFAATAAHRLTDVAATHRRHAIWSQESASRGMQEGRLAIPLYLTLILVMTRYLGSWRLPVYDDAYITFRYAKNLAMGNGLVFQAGETVLGTTSPAFCLIAAAIHALHVPIEPGIIVLNTAADALSLLITFWVLVALGNPMAAVLFSVFFAVSPIATRICVGGMEVNLFLLASTFAIFLYHSGNRTSAMALAAASVLIRPEGLVLVGVLLLVDLYGRRPLSTAGLALVALGVLIPALAVIHAYFGHIIPQSVVAKARQLNSSPILMARAFLFPDPVSIVLLPLALWGGTISLRQDTFVRTAALWGMAYLSVYLVMRPHAWSWYGEPVHYVLFLLGAIGTADLLRRLRRRPAWLTPQKVAVGLGTAAVATWAALLVLHGPSEVTKFVYRPLEAWCREHLSRDATILAGDIGALGYFSGARIYDLNGFVWPAALSYSSTREIITARQPDYLFLGTRRTRIALMQADLSQLYVPVRRFSASNQSNLYPQPDTLSDEWSADYILFRRIAERRSAGAP